MDRLFDIMKNDLDQSQIRLLFDNTYSHSECLYTKYTWGVKIVKKLSRYKEDECTLCYAVNPDIHTFKQMTMVFTLPTVTTSTGLLRWKIPTFDDMEFVIKDVCNIKYSHIHSNIISLINNDNIIIGNDYHQTLEKTALIIHCNWFYDLNSEDGFPLFLCSDCTVFFRFKMCSINDLVELQNCSMSDLTYENIPYPDIYCNYKIKTAREISEMSICARRIYKIPHEISYQTYGDLVLHINEYFPVEAVVITCTKSGGMVAAISHIKVMKNNTVIYDEAGYFYNNIMQYTTFNKILNDKIYFISFNDNPYTNSAESSINSQKGYRLIISISEHVRLNVCYLQTCELQFCMNKIVFTNRLANV